MTKVLLGDVAEEVREKYQPSNCSPIVVGLENLVPGEIRLKNWNSDNEKNTTFTKAFHKGQILFGRRRAYLKKACVAPSDGICSGDITVISAKPGKILPELLPFVIQNDGFFEYAVGKSAGSLSPRVKWSQLKEYEFQLPEINEQHKLAEVLWQLVDTKEAYKNLLAQTDELVKSQFIEMFGTPEEVINKTTTTIADVADVQVGIVIKPTRFYTDTPSTYRAFRSQNVGPMHVIDSSWVYFTEDAMKINKKTIVHKGDVLVVRSGYPGTSCVVSEAFDGSNVVDLIIARPHVNRILPDFLAAFTNSDYGKIQIEKMQRGVAQKHLNISMYSRMKIIVPSISRQRTFIDFMRQRDKSKFTMLN